MAQATQDLVIRMKTDSQNFNDGIEKAKGKVRDFKREGEGAGDGFKQGMATAKAAIAKIAIAVGAATAAIKTYKNFAEQTQTWGDELNNTIDACKTTFQNLEREILMGGNIAIGQIKKMYDEAYKLAQLKDEMGTLKITQQWKRGQFLNAYNEARANYAEAKQNKDEEGMAEAAREMNKALHEYANNSQKIIRESQKTTEQILKTAGIGLKNGQTIDDLIDEFVAAQEGELMPITQTLKELSKKTTKTYAGGTAGSYTVQTGGLEWGKARMRNMGYSDAQVEAAARQLILSELNDPILLDAINTRQEGQSIETEINNYRRTNARTLKPETEITANTTTISAQKVEIDGGKMTFEQKMQYMHKGMQNQMLIDDRTKDSDLIDIELLDEDIEEPETDALIEEYKRKKKAEDEQREAWLKQMNTLNQYAQTLGYVANVFGALSSIINDDSPWKKFVNVLGAVVGGIENVITAYASLTASAIAAQAIKAGEALPFPYNIAMIAAAGASLISIIAAIKASAKSQHFANGGIVGGHDYNDGIHANLSSGEMVINRQQQLKLWNIIQGMSYANPALMGVRFIIEGEQLVGVIDNYNKNINY